MMDDTGTFLVLAQDIEQARQQTHEFYTECHPEKIETIDRWFPTRLSPSGQEPTTHYLCWYRKLPAELWEEMLGRIASHKMPLLTERVPAGVTKEEWLATKGLKEVA
jgi:hypothetical protein